MTTMVFWF